MASENALGTVFQEWVCAQHIEGYEVQQTDQTHLRLEGSAFLGEVNLYPLEDGSEVVELRVTCRADDEYVFFLHFALDDLVRAQKLFGEMREALMELAAERRAKVLLCCTCGITTTMFATKLGKAAETLGLGYQVHACPLNAAIASGERYDVVMLAPQVAYERARVAVAFPMATVFEIPAKVYGTYDAVAGLRLIVNALDGHNRAAVRQVDMGRLPENLRWEGRIMVVSSVLGNRQSSFEYRVFDRGELILEGMTTKRSFDFRDLEDLLADVRLQGIDVSRLDAIGIAVPGIVEDEMISLFSYDVHGYDLGGHIRKTYGVPVFLDNDANAAAAGVSAIQHSYRNIMFHRQSFGHEVGGQGTVLDGRLNRGRKNFAGEVDHLMRAIAWSDEPTNLAWTEDGMYELVSRYLLLAAVEVAPEAIYVDAYPVDDMDRLRAELLPFLGEEYLPDLIPAPDFNECMLLGELALCIQRLRQ